ncbi:MAG: hypothetical protein HC829_03485 [Bacteroidales bacterium]|nr:hypothetical protein [Candidatus Methylacidiphilales bacterium]NJO54012.1 hypothetical protein [Bacteroidales bacterium]
MNAHSKVEAPSPLGGFPAYVHARDASNIADLQAKLDAAHAALRDLDIKRLQRRLLTIADTAKFHGGRSIVHAAGNEAAAIDTWMRRHGATFLAAIDAKFQRPWPDSWAAEKETAAINSWMREYVAGGLQREALVRQTSAPAQISATLSSAEA